MTLDELRDAAWKKCVRDNKILDADADAMKKVFETGWDLCRTTMLVKAGLSAL